MVKTTKDKSWYRDEIDMLKGNQEHMRWKIMGIITIFLAVASLCYVVWYNEDQIIPRFLIVIVFVCISLWAKRNLDICIVEGKRLSKIIGEDYQHLLK